MIPSKWTISALFLLLCIQASAAHAEKIKLFISSGTGFFVHRGGVLLTNLHVVKDCQKITISGAVSPRPAEIIARDTEYDLALLKTDVPGVDTARLSISDQPLKAGDRVILVGYPGQAFKSGNTVTREARVVETTGPRGEEKWLQLSDVVNEGNSGGPLLDSAGTVVGVVSAKAVIYTYRSDAPQDGTTSQQGIAISLPIVKAFLDRENISYQSTNAESYLSNDRLTDLAHRFTVNVQCQYKTEVIR